MIKASESVALYSKLRHWFGPSLLIYGEKAIDGRARFAALYLLPGKLRLSIEVPRHRVRNASEACSLLALNSHYRRAAEYLPPLCRTVDEITTFTWLPKKHVQKLHATTFGLSQSERPRLKLARVRTYLEEHPDSMSATELIDSIEGSHAWIGERKAASFLIAESIVDECSDLATQINKPASVLVRAALNWSFANHPFLTRPMFVKQPFEPVRQTTRVVVRMSPDMIDYISAVSRQYKCSRSAVVETALTLWLAQNHSNAR